MASSLVTNDITTRLLVTSAVSSVFEPRSGQTKDNNIGSCCFFTKHYKGEIAKTGSDYTLFQYEDE
jgi:hypothetical protein